MNESSKPTDDKGNARFCLTLPGRKLYIQPLLTIKKFHHSSYLLRDCELSRVMD